MWIVIGIVALLLGGWIWAEHGHLLLDSTRRMIKLSGWKRFWKGTILHGYFYSRWPRLYVWLGGRKVAPHLGQRGGRWLEKHYHGKVVPTELAKSLITVNQDVDLRSIEHVIPFPIARDLVLSGPPDIAVIDCPCRLTSEHPCEPIRVCMVVGQPFVDFMLEHHPNSSERLTTEQALELLEAEHQRGHIHTAYFKDAAADRFYAICNCCKCCCGGIDVMNKYGINMIIPSGFVARVDETLCLGCGTCAETCAFGGMSVIDGIAALNWDNCVGCGACEATCPAGAIILARDEAKGIPLDINALLAESKEPAQ